MTGLPPMEMGLRIAGGFALLFGALTVVSGGFVLFGGQTAMQLAGNVVRFVVWFNFLAGAAYMAVGIGMFLRKRWALLACVGDPRVHSGRHLRVCRPCLFRGRLRDKNLAGVDVQSRGLGGHFMDRQECRDEGAPGLLTHLAGEPRLPAFCLLVARGFKRPTPECHRRVQQRPALPRKQPATV